MCHVLLVTKVLYYQITIQIVAKTSSFIPLTIMDDTVRRLKASLQLFDKLECYSSVMNGDFEDVDTALSLVDIDKMRCHVINCLIALHLVCIEKKTKESI
jgi:hypothetical protein